MISTECACYKVHALTTAEEVEKLRPFWLRMNRHPDADIDFYSLIAAANPHILSPYVLVATGNGQPKAMLVGRLENGTIPIKLGYFELLALKVRQLAFLQEGFVGDCTPAVVSAMVRQILIALREKGADRAILCNVDVTSELFRSARTMPGLCSRDYSKNIVQRWRTILPSTMDEFLKRRSKKHRYWLRRIGRVFEEDHPGKVRYEIYEKQADVEVFSAAAEKVAQNTYQRGLGVGFVKSAETVRRLELAAEKGWLKAYLILVEQEPVAFWCGRLYNGIMYLDWTGYKPAYRKYELGTILFLKMVEDLCRSGAGEIDYGTGAAFYKERFGDHERTEGMVSVYSPTVKGFAKGTLMTVEIALNRTAKAVVQKLKIGDRIRKLWRFRLAGTGQKAE